MTDQTNPTPETQSAHDQREDLPVRMLDLPVKQEAPVQVSERPRYTLSIPTGGGAVMFIVNPVCDPHLEWMMRYASDLNQSEAGRFSAASILASFDYLLSSHIPATEAIRRLRMMRHARREAVVRAQVAAASLPSTSKEAQQ